MKSIIENGVIIQARSSSKRLPGKVVRPFHGTSTILDLIIRNIIKEIEKQKIVLATTENKQDDIICEVGSTFGINIFRGSEEDVLKRFINASEKFGIKNAIRICADNPFMQPDKIKELFYFPEEQYDYIGYRIKNGIPAIKSHLGLYPEMVSINALKRISQLTKDPKYLEHVTNYIYEHPQEFNIKWIDVDKEVYSRSDLRLTIDTPEDYEMCQQIYEEFLALPQKTISNLVNIIDKNPVYKEVMQMQIKSNSK